VEKKSKMLASIVSAGMSRIGKRENHTSRELFAEAFLECLDRASNLGRKDIGAIYVGSQSETYEHQIMYGNLIAEAAGLIPTPAIRVEGCAAAGAIALRSAIIDVISGLHDVVLAVGVEKMTAQSVDNVTDALMAASEPTLEQYNGLTFPSIYAMMAVDHMHRFGSTEEDLAKVAVKNHHNGTLNPKAHMQREITVEDVLKSKVITSPLKLYDCSPISDGAAVALVCKPELAKKYSDRPIQVLGMGTATDTLGLYSRIDISWPNAASLASRESFKMAKIDPAQVKLAELHDAFTINEILLCEACGFSERGRGHILVREGETSINGKVSVNPSGGLKARGHPTGATGLAQVYEIFLQLREEADKKRQVSKPDYALAINEGGSDAVVVSHIFGR
jgi:acetyl-CoA acetyltransferase